MIDPLFALIIALLVIGLLLALLWPRQGFIWRWRAAGRMNDRIQREDALKHIQKMSLAGQTPTIRSIAGTLAISTDQAAKLLAELEQRDLLSLQDGEWSLTSVGEAIALHVIRAHRLWEQHLAEQTGYQQAEWHTQAESYEHMLSPEEVARLARSLGNPSHDPHGDPIPTAEGQFLRQEGLPMTSLQPEQAGRIVHIPDEPEAIAAQLRAEALYPGMVVRISESTPQRVRFWVNGNEHVLAPIVAADVAVVPLVPEQIIESPPGHALDELPVGELAEVVSLSPRCRGPERRRLMDLGILPGTQISAELVSPSGDPTAYLVRDTLIALRSEQAHWIKIKRLETEAI